MYAPATMRQPDVHIRVADLAGDTQCAGQTRESPSMKKACRRLQRHELPGRQRAYPAGTDR